MAFKMKGFSGFGNSPIKQNQEARQISQQNYATKRKREKKLSLYKLGYFKDDDGTFVHPFGEGENMDKDKWNEWKSKSENKPYKGKTKGLL